MGMRVGEVAKQAGVNLQTIRYYEREGLLAPPPRLASGYRIFSGGAVRRVRFIKRAQELGFSLAEIREILAINNREGASQVRERTTAKIADIDQKIETLKAMKVALSSMVDRCPGCGPLSECPIVDALEDKGVLA
jgi:MerR family mercuric resistance operon transcriptional regulator